ncbi:patatin [Thioploca ingrica]|uniref:Patatin n=1 Tax=Thioploca ingrica TaxID=40754 RepID=A0A090AP94_9GAMM|nr:patatin [Thioploca ingrica]
MKKILQVDGGGIRGIIPAVILAYLEEKCGKPLCQCFDLITGTSTGAIIGGGIAAGIPANEIKNLYINKGRELFTKRTLFNPANWLRGKYDRRPFIEEIEKQLGKCKEGQIKPLGQLKLANLYPHFMATAFNLSSQRTHFIKSWDPKDQLYNIVDVIAWSALSAVYYFDKINVAEFEWYDYQMDKLDSSPHLEKKGAVFQDGGQGIHNNTLGYVLTEVLANRWTQEEIYILSLGTGEPDEYISYEAAAQFHLTEQLKSYLLCQARKESTVNQVLAAYHVSSHANPNEHPHITFRRIDKVLDKEEVGLDKVEYIKKYQQYGNELISKFKPEDIELLKM